METNERDGRTCRRMKMMKILQTVAALTMTKMEEQVVMGELYANPKPKKREDEEMIELIRP